MIKNSKRSEIPTFLALDGMRIAQEMEAAGDNIIHLEVGQPSTAAPQQVTDGLIAALSQAGNHGYSTPLGVPALRNAIAQHYHDTYGYHHDSGKIAVTVGSSTAFALAFLAAFDEGDKVALPTPGYPAYRNLMMAMGIEPVALPARAEQGWMPALKAMEEWDELPDGIIIASPHNPTGVVLSDAEMREICDWCKNHSVRLISDEIYHGLTYGTPAQTAGLYNDEAIIISGFSKYYSMTGWRLGWLLMPDDLADRIEKLVQNLFIAAPTPNQMGAIHAFAAKDELQAHLSRYATNRDILLSGLSPLLLGNHAPCDGAFYLYVDISALSDDSLAFSKALLEREGVATTSGVDFDQEQGHLHLRLSFAGSTDDMHEAVKRINRFVDYYQQSNRRSA